MFSAGILLALATLAVAQTSQPWGQCAGIGYTGPTVCPAGWVCTYNNAYYSQCLQGSGSGTTTAGGGGTTTGGGGTTTGGSTPTATTSSLNALAKSKGKLYFGSATDNPELTDTAYVSILTGGMFGQITPGNSMKWGPTEPSQNTYTYTQGDQILSLATSHNMIVRGHNLCWYEQLPSWLSSGSFNNATLVSILQSHITSEVTHYKGQVYAWDVVNEPFDDSGGMRSWLYQNTVGTSYIADAFTAAHAADPNAKLYLNDYNLEYSGAKFNTALSTITSLVQQGVPIHVVGFEGHMIVGSVPSAASIAANMNQFTALGLEVAFTEIDIRMTLPATAALLQQQATDYQTMVTACMMVEKCVGITVWDFTDKYSWVPSTFSGQGEACPWDANLQPKPAFNGIVAGLNS